MKLFQLSNASHFLGELNHAILKPAELGIKIHRIIQELAIEVDPYRKACADADKRFLELKNYIRANYPLLDSKIKKPEKTPEFLEQEKAFEEAILPDAEALTKEKKALGEEEREFILKASKLKLSEIEKATLREAHNFSFAFLSALSEFTE